MKNANITFIAVLATIFLVGTASTSKAQAPTCAELGYSKSASECGASKTIKCPTDTGKVFCVEKCPSVSVSKYEVCTKKCADDANVCIEKRNMTCNEYVQANNGELISDDATVSGTKTKNLYLMGTLKDVTGSNAYLNRIKLVQASVFAAIDIPACKAEGAKEAFFNVSYLTIEGYSSFNVKTNIGYLYFSPSSSTYWTATFTKDSNIKVNMSANSTWITSLTLYFDGNMNGDGKVTNNKVSITCEGMGSGDSWYKDKCNLDINNYYANVTYCKNYTGSNVELNVNCSNMDDGNGSVTCKEDYSGCWY